MSRQNICKFTSSILTDTLTVSLFVLESDPAVMERRQRQAEHRLLLVKEGELLFHVGTHTYPLGAGRLLFVLKGEELWAEPRGACEYMYIGFDGTRAEGLLRRFDIRADNRTFSGFDGLIPLWSESLARASEQTVDLAAESILLYTFSRLHGSVRQADTPADRLVRLTEERFTDPALSLAALAEELNYNPKYLSHAFRQHMGVGYSEYLRDLRVKYAVSLFDHGIGSVKNVALLSGFTDPLYFSTVFKKSLGLSPTEYLAKGK